LWRQIRGKYVVTRPSLSLFAGSAAFFCLLIGRLCVTIPE
jgi:hypothetical protein